MAIDSTKLKNNEKLHLVIDVRRKELIAFEISDQRDVQVAERLIEGIKGKSRQRICRSRVCKEN